ncbi:hypothetical protein [Burkholderia sp. LMG 21824]|uniref:hypothetical protein n=1 Tax=Burkholderia sp. LMG 21824 TaxID=3158172 RepID=UPI003C2EB3B0
MQILWPEIDSARDSIGHRLLLFDGNAPPLSIAMLGWRFTWERRFSLQTLARCSRHYPPFGLLEWLAFMPAQLPPVGVLDEDDWLLRYFVHALGESWTAWCTIAAGM